MRNNYDLEISELNLQQTIQSLEENNIAVAINIGVHKHCNINSNCPLAVELRKLVHKSGITLAQLIEGFTASQESAKEVSYTLPEFNGKAVINIAGQEVTIDFSDVIERQMGAAFAMKKQEFNGMGLQIKNIGSSLFASYTDKIQQLEQTKTLPQLEFSTKELIKANCLITSNNARGCYPFLFARRYNPQWIITNRKRYKMATKDIKKVEGDIYIQFTISKAKKIVNTVIFDSAGDKFSHYHGGGHREGDDCWGQVKLPDVWDGTLESLSNLVIQLMGSLATINKDSLWARHPNNMPSIDSLMERSTELGEEGLVEEREQPRGGWDTEDNGEEAPPRRWGNGREQRAVNVQRLTPEEERMRRWGNPEVPADMEIVCALCGEMSGRHYDLGLTCPRDHVRR